MINKDNTKIFTGKYYYGLGRRKTSIAKIRLYPGKGVVVINGKNLEDLEKQNNYTQALVLTNNKNKFNVSVVVRGGGLTGWKDSINLACARALVNFDKNYRQILKKHGFLRRDPREVERKKPGLKKARRAPQWQKR